MKRKPPKTPKLKQIDLSKCCHRKDGQGHGESWHPDIKARKQYLALLGGEFYAGQFQLEWYGWNFMCGFWECGYQLDKPRTNASDWEGLWEIVKAVRPKAKKKIKYPRHYPNGHEFHPGI